MRLISGFIVFLFSILRFDAAHATDFVLWGDRTNVAYVQGSVATSEEMCSLLSHSIFRRLPLRNDNGRPLFEVPTQAVEMLFRGIPVEVFRLRLDEAVRSEIIKNLDSCSQPRLHQSFFPMLLASLHLPRFVVPDSFARSDIDSSRAEVRNASFLLLLGLKETHGHLSEALNDADSRWATLESQAALSQTTEAKGSGASTSDQIQAAPIEMQNEGSTPSSNLIAREETIGNGVQTEEAHKSDGSIADVEDASPNGGVVAFLKLLGINLVAIASILLLAAFFYVPRLRSERAALEKY